MENVLKLVLLGVGVVIVVVIISFVMQLNNTGSQTVTQGINQLNAELSGLVDTDKAIYDGTSVSGTDVIQAIQKYNMDSNLYVIVSTIDTTGGTNIIYDNSLITAVKGGATAEDVINTYVKSQLVSGWPAKYANGDPFTTQDAEGKILPDFATLTFPTCSSLTLSNAGAAPAAGDDLYIEQSGYDSTKTSFDKGYISPNATFNASIQRNQNNEVKFVTFIQK